MKIYQILPALCLLMAAPLCAAQETVKENVVVKITVSGAEPWWNLNTELNALRLPPPPAGAEILYIDITGDGKPDVLRTVTANGTPVQWIDDNGNMKVGDVEGDLVADCLMIDRNRDGKFGGPGDIIVDYADTDNDGKADIQIVVENKVDVKKWGGHYMIFFDLDNDNVFNYMDYNTFELRCWLHDGLAYFYSDYIGDSRFLKIHNDPTCVDDVRLNWENPFEFIDADGDGLTEMTVRLLDMQPNGPNGNNPNGLINWAGISVDLDNDNTQENPFDLDMTIGFFTNEGGTSYAKYSHVYQNLRGLPEADMYFDDPRWRQNNELIYPDREQCFDFIYKDAKWDRAYLSYDEDGDCKRWERVEFWNHNRPPKDIWATGKHNGGMDEHNQSDPCGDRGEWDQDFSGKGNLYVSPIDGKIHLYGAEAGVWRVDQRAQYYQNMGGLYDVYGVNPEGGKPIRQAPFATAFPTVLYEDTDNNGFFDKVSFDWNFDREFEEVISLKDLFVCDEADVIETSRMRVVEYNELYTEVAYGIWHRAEEAVKVAKKLGLNPAWYSLYMSPRSLRQHYECGYWLQLYIYHDIVDLARRTGDKLLEKTAARAFVSGNWDCVKTSSDGKPDLVNSVSLRVNHKDGLYAKGDTVRVWADVLLAPEDSVVFKVMRWCDWKNVESESGVALKEGSTLLLERVFDESVQYVFELTDNVRPKDFTLKNGKGNVFAGVVVAPEEFTPGLEQPDDLYAYWNRQIKSMRRHKMKPVVTNESVKDGCSVYHVDINCVGPAPARAYVAHPENAQKGTLPIILYLHYAGSPGRPSEAKTALKYANYVEGGALAMDLNAHGMPDDQTPEFYTEIGKGYLKGYSSREPSNLDDYYFKWMMLRAVRALDYLTSNPLWDGKHIIVTGTSQGGYQSAWLAGIDPRITSAIITVPAGIDQGATIKGRPASWPKTIYKYRESSLKNLPYMDPAAFMKNTKADVWCEIGLYDFTCPAANLLAVMNTLNCDKTVVTYQRPHTMAFHKEDHRCVDKQRKEYFQKAAKK